MAYAITDASRRETTAVPQYVIEREFPGAGKLTYDDLQGIATRVVDAVRALGPQVKWVNSYVTDDRIFCVFDAPDESTMREHARIGALPLARVMQVRQTLGPWAANPPRRREVDEPRAPER